MCVRGCDSSKKAERRVTWVVQVLRSPNLFKKNYSPQEAGNAVICQRNHPVDIYIFTMLKPRLHGRSKRFFRRPQNLNAPRSCCKCNLMKDYDSCTRIQTAGFLGLGVTRRTTELRAKTSDKRAGDFQDPFPVFGFANYTRHSTVDFKCKEQQLIVSYATTIMIIFETKPRDASHCCATNSSVDSMQDPVYRGMALNHSTARKIATKIG